LAIHPDNGDLMKTIFSHMTMIGLQDHEGQWWKVVEHCARCGQCCDNKGPGWHFGFGEILEGCKYLEKEDDGTHRCDLRSSRPLSCSCNSPFSKADYCSVRFEKIDEPSSLL
jgi:hypothetical protein